MTPGAADVDLQFRPATPDDAASCVDLRGRTRENAFSEDALAALGITRESWANGISDGSCPGHVCQSDGTLVGMSFSDRDSGEVLVVAVLPEFEGLGIGRRLLERSVRDLKAHGHVRSFLGCNRDPSSRSHGFYRRLGWRSTGRFDTLGDEVLELPL